MPATQIGWVARDLGENAMIGSTTMVDGVEVPYPPVAYGIHGAAAKFHNSVQTNRAICSPSRCSGLLSRWEVPTS